jgi:hypothetical protein
LKRKDSKELQPCNLASFVPAAPAYEIKGQGPEITGMKANMSRNYGSAVGKMSFLLATINGGWY